MITDWINAEKCLPSLKKYGSKCLKCDVPHYKKLCYLSDPVMVTTDDDVFIARLLFGKEDAIWVNEKGNAFGLNDVNGWHHLPDPVCKEEFGFDEDDDDDDEDDDECI